MDKLYELMDGLVAGDYGGNKTSFDSDLSEELEEVVQLLMDCLKGDEV